MTTCTYCNQDHAASYKCNAQYQASLTKVVHRVVHKETLGSSRHGKYADPEARKRYRREWMRKKRLGSHPTGVT
jgi:hypothetical protein